MRVSLVGLTEADKTTVAGIAAFVAARNGDDAQHIGYLGEDAEDVAGTLAELEPGALFALAHDDGGELVGLLGADWDLDVRRAWLYGPYGRGTDSLYTALATRIPPGVVHELYCSTGNRAVVDFAGRHGFGQGGLSRIYELDRADALAQAPADAVPLPPERFERFAALYREIFPTAPYTPEAVAGRIPPPLVILDGEDLLGFVVLRLTPEFGNGELEHIGVVDAARGRGVGRRLLRSAVHAAFQDPRMRTLILNTSATNDVGQRLYESVGFRHGRDMVSFTRG